MDKKKLRCVVLSQDMVPISIIDSLRAVVKNLQGRVYVLETHPDVYFHSMTQRFEAPSVICHKKYSKLPNFYYVTAGLTLDNLRIRDGSTCQYCGRRGSELNQGEFWTKDHIMPVSKGGENRWENLVLSCNTCNNLKGDRTPEEAGMRLLTGRSSLLQIPTRWHIDLLKELE